MYVIAIVSVIGAVVVAVAVHVNVNDPVIVIESPRFQSCPAITSTVAFPCTCTATNTGTATITSTITATVTGFDGSP